MGKRKGNRGKKDRPRKQANKEYTAWEVVKTNENFMEYYRRSLSLQQEEMEVLQKVLQEHLPITFRVNCYTKNYQRLIERISSPEFIAHFLGEEEREAINLRRVDWYPESLTWEMTCTKKEMKKMESVKRLHKWLQDATETGLVTRQELVSMLPPLILDVQPGMKVLDMCAAPGSKTAQLIEYLQGNGVIVANDVDQNRAYMLIHQINRAHTAGIVIVNHPAQQFPSIGARGDRYRFDRVLCDVPCSGDGAIRKLPQKWKNWNVKDGAVLHPLQLTIAKRGLELCEVGGLLCYSTCSINPIEDEAVVAELLRQYGSYVELIDLPQYLTERCPGLIFRPGLPTWPVYGNAREKEQGLFDEYKSMADVPEITKFVRESMFPAAEGNPEMAKTVRIMPHDQDTGGFYLALFRKTGKIVQPSTEAAEPEETKAQPETEEAASETEPQPDAPVEEEKKEELATAPKNPKRRPIYQNQHDFVCITGLSAFTDWDYLVNLWGLTASQSNFYTSSDTTFKNLYFVNPEVVDFLGQADIAKVKILNLGVRAFVLNKQRCTTDVCKYRVCQDSLPFLSKYITKRRIEIPDTTPFLEMIGQEKIPIERFGGPEILEQFVDKGYFILSFPELGEEVMVSNDGMKVRHMMSKEHATSLRIKYLPLS